MRTISPLLRKSRARRAIASWRKAAVPARCNPMSSCTACRTPILSTPPSPTQNLESQAASTGPTVALGRSEEHTSELQSLMRISYAVFCLKNKTKTTDHQLNATSSDHKRHHIKQLQR